MSIKFQCDTAAQQAKATPQTNPSPVDSTNLSVTHLRYSILSAQPQYHIGPNNLIISIQIETEIQPKYTTEEN
jgi:hypothetical protein